MGRAAKTRLSGLERFGLDERSLRLLPERRARAYVYLRTYDVTPKVRKLPPSARQANVSNRVDQWMKGLRRLFPELSFEIPGKAIGNRRQRWPNLPTTLRVSCAIRELLPIARSRGVSSVYVSKLSGLRPRRESKPKLEWYCIRALVVIRVESATSGLQNTEDRFVLVRASSFKDAKQRLRKQWLEYSSPYLNSDRQIVSWQLDKVVDIYETGETEINPGGTEVYSKLNSRRMRPAYVWHPPRTGPIFQLKR